MTNLDGLDTVETIKVCIGYRVGSTRYDSVAADVEVLSHCEPVYSGFAGGRALKNEVRKWKELPAKARAYLKARPQLRVLLPDAIRPACARALTRRTKDGGKAVAA